MVWLSRKVRRVYGRRLVGHWLSRRAELQRGRGETLDDDTQPTTMTTASTADNYIDNYGIINDDEVVAVLMTMRMMMIKMLTVMVITMVIMIMMVISMRITHALVHLLRIYSLTLLAESGISHLSEWNESRS